MNTFTLKNLNYTRIFFKNLFLLFLIVFYFQLNLSANENDFEEMEKITELNQLKENSPGQKLKKALAELDSGDEDSFRNLKTVLRSFFASIPYYPQIKIDSNNTLQLVLYSVFKASGVCVNLGKSNDMPILIVKYDDKNYFVSCRYYKERPIPIGVTDSAETILLMPFPKKKRIIRSSKINRKKDVEYKSFNEDGISFDVVLYGNDTKYQEWFFKNNPKTEQIDSKLKIDIGVSFDDISISEDKTFSCDMIDIKDLLKILVNGEEFREDIDTKINELKNTCTDLFKKIPYEIRNEKGYDLVLYSIFKMNGLNVGIEQASSAGRSDLLVDEGGNIYVFELKYSFEKYDVIKGWDQIIIKRYSEKYYYEKPETSIFGIVISFGPSQRVEVGISKTLPTVTPLVNKKKRKQSTEKLQNKRRRLF